MLKNYFKISLRHIFKEGIYSAIKLLGLAVGLAACLIITLFVYEDLSFDGIHKNKSRIVRALTIDSAQGVESQEVGVTQPALGPAAKEELPEVEDYVRMVPSNNARVRKGDQEFRIESGILTESNFFEVFDFEIIEGQKEGVLDEPFSTVLTESEAKRLFGDEDPIGQSLQMGPNELNIKAIMKDPPSNSHLQFDIVRSIVAPEDNPGWQQWLTSWGGLSMHNYLLLNEEYDDLDPIIAKLVDLKTKNEAAEFFTPTLQKMSDIHLRSKHILFENNHAKTDITNVYIMVSIGIVVLVLACVNFVNLVTAKAPTRAREVGVRKVMGGLKRQLIIQHLTETTLISTASFILAIVIVFLTLPLLNGLYNRSADITVLLNSEIILTAIGFLAVLILVSGFYPAFVLSSFNPSEVLKGSFSSGHRGVILRKSLVVFQFAISISLIIGAGVIYQQMNYIMTRDMGYDRDMIVNIALNGQMMPQAEAFRNELKALPYVKNVGSSSSRIGQQLGRNSINPEGSSEEDNYITSVMFVDANLIPSMNMQILQGRNFSDDIQTDSASAMLINEALAAMLEWEDPVGRIIRLGTGPDGEETEFSIVGVVKDFNFATVQHSIEPLYMRYNRNNGILSVKLEGSNVKSEMEGLEATWKKVYPDNMFEYTFLDESFAQLYTKETAFSRMFSHLTFLAIFIAVIGLFGLSAYSAQQKTKEIGIRKVLGANVGQIVLLLSKDFMMLVGFSFVISIPLAWLGMNEWLDSFVYRIDIGVGVFLLSALAAVFVAFSTVCWHSISAALMNPVVSLRDE